ncbi:MAG: fatty acid desaturase [Parvularculaceae bacterium]
MSSTTRARFSSTPLLGVVVALTIMAAWFAHLAYCLLVQPVAAPLPPLHVATLSFLNVGLFITAHDAMHGSLAPRRRRLNVVFGAVAMFLYGGFLWSRMRANHLAHHAAPVSVDDPDYAADGDERFAPWLLSFVRGYYSWRNFALMHVHVAAAWAVSGSIVDVLVFFALPAWLSALQLFTFGVYLPHRTPPNGHDHPHRAKTIDLPEWLSFLTCYHFGCHEEHHDHPSVPWWRLPAVRRARRAEA